MPTYVCSVPSKSLSDDWLRHWGFLEEDDHDVRDLTLASLRHQIDVTSDPKVAPRHLAMVDRAHNRYLAETVVENHEAGLLYVEGRLVERLAPGRHAYWTVDRKVDVMLAE